MNTDRVMTSKDGSRRATRLDERNWQTERRLYTTTAGRPVWAIVQTRMSLDEVSAWLDPAGVGGSVLGGGE